MHGALRTPSAILESAVPARLDFLRVRVSDRRTPFKAMDGGFMDSIYFSDPNGLRLELALL